MRPEAKDVLAPDLKELILRAESPRPVSPAPTPPPVVTALPGSEDGAEYATTSTGLEEGTNEANNNTLSPADLSSGRDNPTIIEEEDEKN